MTFIEVDIGAYVLWIPTSQSWMLQKSAAPWMKDFLFFNTCESLLKGCFPDHSYMLDPWISKPECWVVPDP